MAPQEAPHKKYSRRFVILCSLASVLAAGLLAVIALAVLARSPESYLRVRTALGKLGILPEVPTHPSATPENARRASEAYARIIARRDAELDPEQQRQLMTLYHRLGIWEHMWYLGIPIQKNPCDLWMMQQLLFEVQPDYVIEAGTLHGGSALYFAHILDGLGLDDARVLTIDIENQCQQAAQLPLWKEKVEFILGSSTDPQIVADIARRVSGKRVLVVLDSDHSRDHVLAELKAYAPMVNPGSYVVVEDTNIDGVPVLPEYGPGPMLAVEEFLPTDEGKHFVQDVSREAMVLTFNPGGWLKREDSRR